VAVSKFHSHLNLLWPSACYTPFSLLLHTRIFIVYPQQKPGIKDSYRVKSVMPQFACHSTLCNCEWHQKLCAGRGETEPPPRKESVFPQTKHSLIHKPFNYIVSVMRDEVTAANYTPQTTHLCGNLFL
jgi:hypothetical protein